MSLPAASLLLLAVALAGTAPQSPAAAALRPIPLETFPPAARGAISRAYADASSRPADPAAAGALARTLHAWEQWEAAHENYRRASALAPRSFEWRYLDAVVLQRLGRHRDAADALQEALSIKADYLPAQVRAAEALLDAGELRDSAARFSALTSVAAAEPAAQVGLGRIAAAEGRHDDAVRHFERAVALFPELGAAYYGLARSYRSMGRTADAERAAAQHARYGARWPGLDDPVLASVTSLREDARATLARGIALGDAGDVAAAIDAHEAALARDASLTQAHVNLVGLYGRAGDWSKAEAHYQAAVAQGANEASLHYDYGVVLGLQQRWDAAAEAYRAALAANPLHVQARNNLGQILERRREFAAAAAEYQRAVDGQPTFRLARFNLGRMLLATGDNDRALAEFEKLQQPVDADTPRYLFALSTALVRTGRMADGRRVASEARRLAIEFNQPELARAIESELSKLK
jgi:tetratricopeptide (TPR) repeat protein